jgi:hypothetical protein
MLLQSAPWANFVQKHCKFHHEWSLFFQNVTPEQAVSIGPSTQYRRFAKESHMIWDACSALVLRNFFDPQVGTFVPRSVYLDEGERRCPVARVLSNADDDHSVSQNKDDIDTEIADLFASRAPAADEFSDPNVQIRIALLIARAMNRPARWQRQAKPR